MNTGIEHIVSIDKCTGCFTCYNSCNTNAIKMKLSQEGFYIPTINKLLCIDCNNCNENCPSLNNYSKNFGEKYRIYGGWSLNEDNRQESSSGGICSEIIKYILNENGVVFGVGFDEGSTLKHIEINNIKDLKILRGSKYLQSYVDDSLKRVKKYLIEGRKVLFIGTPCHIAGLNNFIKNHENLITIDLVCHGIPSLKVFNAYLENEFHEKGQLNKVIFRYKYDAWSNYSYKFIFNNNECIIQNKNLVLFHRGFNKNLYLNTTCYECRYNVLPRNSDISLGDFWNPPQDLYDEKGISLIICNSSKGHNIIKKLMQNNKINIRLTDLEEVVIGNPMLSNYYKKNIKLRRDFFDDFDKFGFEYVKHKYIGVPELLQIGNKKIVVFGTGSASTKVLSKLNTKISYFIDNNSTKWNTSINNVVINKPEVLMKEDKDKILIVVASSYYKEISNQLDKLGFKENINYINGLRIKQINNDIYFNI